MRSTSIGAAARLAAALALVMPLAAQTPTVFPSLDVHVPMAPRPFAVAGVTSLVYELHVANVSSRRTTLDAIEVRDSAAPADAMPLLRLEGESLLAALQQPSAPGDDPDRRVLTAGRTAVIFVWVSLRGREVPSMLTHRFAVRTAAAPTGQPSSSTAPPDDVAVVVNGVATSVSKAQPRVMGPPLEGDHWLAANGPDNGSGHRRTILALAGEGRVAQRFAIDWVRLFDDGRTFRGDPKSNASYRAFGASVRAVADGAVLDIVDGIPENVPDPVARSVTMTPATLGGNSILLDIGGGAYAFYAHLQPGSLSVKKGDRVQRGQMLARVGNTGNSTEPHLHFHVVDRASAFASEGIPYVFDAFAIEAPPEQVTAALKEVGDTLELSPSGVAAWKGHAPQPRTREMPLLNTILTFSARR